MNKRNSYGGIEICHGRIIMCKGGRNTKYIQILFLRINAKKQRVITVRYL